ncbi:MAG: hypothetical protein M1269_04330 [Chloroflexi bacterium]|nr:hypothetical protein [Chloroflexota bacterium]
MLALQDIINLLDRKFDFLMASKQEDFMLDLANFIEFLLEHDQIKDFTMKIYYKFTEEQKKYEEIQEKEKNQIITLADKIRKKYPEIDDSDKQYPGHPTLDYMRSFAAFDDIVNKKRVKSFPVEPDMMDDDSDPHELLCIICAKIENYEEKDKNGEKIRTMDEDIILEYFHLNDERTYNFREWLNSCRVSAGNALVALYETVSKINPEPKKYKSLQDRDIQLNSFEEKKSIHFDSWIEGAAYGVDSDNLIFKSRGPNSDNTFEKLRYRTKRIYDAVREEIGSQLLHKQILNNYKTRSIWYNFEELWNLVTDSKGKFTNKREQSLTLNLAKFLFDNGVPVIYRLKAGQHEMDMVDPSAKSPLLIEVKVYKDSSSKKEIIAGVAQLHSYLNNLSATRDINEGYYVVYRLGGPIYDLPEKIVTNQFTIYTILIDLGKSQESGSKQKKPIIISENEIIEGFKN